MKKLLSVLGAVGLVATSASSVMAMAPAPNQAEKNVDTVGCFQFIPVNWRSAPKWVTVNGITSNDAKFDSTWEQTIYWNQLGIDDYEEFTKSNLILNFKGISYTLKLGDKEENKAIYNETRRVSNFDIVVTDHETYLLGEKSNLESSRLPWNQNFVKSEISYKVTYYGVTIKLSTYGFAHGTWGNWVGAGGSMNWEGGFGYKVLAK